MINFDIFTEIPVMEHFYTIQGEGYYTGNAAYFIRLAGCDVGCVWCDVKESWTVSKSQLMKIDDLVDFVLQSKTKIVVITGGEPLMYNLQYLTEKLKIHQIQINIETSGAYPISGQLDWICVSPKKFKKPLPAILNIANELKIIVYNNSDFDFAKQNQNQTSTNCKLYLQAEWSKSEIVLPKIIDFVKKNTNWCISLQTHKYLQIP